MIRRVGLKILVVLLAGCQQKMARQPSYRPLDESPFYADGQAARPLVAGTVARGQMRTDLALFTGKKTAPTVDFTRPAGLIGAANVGGLVAIGTAVTEPEDYVTTFPFPITRAVLQHGHDRFMIYCVVCHDPLGTGRGMIVERGYTPPPSYHIERLRQMPPGYFFDIITRGYGSMPSYAAQIVPADRWAIAAYLRALQLSQRFPEKDLTDAMRRDWQSSAKGANP